MQVQVISAGKSQEVIKTYKDLFVWQKSVELAIMVYKITSGFPKNQQYGLVSQIERAAVSIASNIAEGAGRKGSKEFVQYISIAKGSLYELETQFIISNRVGFISQENLDYLVIKIEEIGRMLNGLKRSLEN